MEELRKLLQELFWMVMGGLNQATQVRVEDNKHCIVTHDFLSEYESTIYFLEELGLAEPLPKCEWRLRFDKIDEVVEQKLFKQVTEEEIIVWINKNHICNITSEFVHILLSHYTLIPKED